MKKSFITLIIFAILVAANSTISASKNKYLLKGSIDENLFSSQKFGCDIAQSSISIIAHISDLYELNDNFSDRFRIGYSTFMIALLNHEISGHGFRIIEFGGQIDEIGISFFSGYVRPSYSNNKHIHLQESALVSLGGNEVNNKLAENISKSWIVNNQEIDPTTAFAYIFSKGNQCYYSYILSDIRGSDLVSYSNHTVGLYGEGSMGINEIQSWAFLDLLDPILLYSLYSASTGYYMEIPKFEVMDSLEITPFARMVLTPFGIIEKQFGAYIFTDYSLIEFSFSYGKQSKGELVSYNEIIKANENIIDYGGVFTGLKQGEVVDNQSSYNINLSIYKMFQINNFEIGLDFTFWNQPELFTKDPYREESKNGYMLVLNALYSLNDFVSLESHAGYKSKGFVPAQHIEQGVIFGFTLNYQL